MPGALRHWAGRYLAIGGLLHRQSVHVYDKLSLSSRKQKDNPLTFASAKARSYRPGMSSARLARLLRETKIG
jgi:hypothetical protein